jgi:hypothetical protein
VTFGVYPCGWCGLDGTCTTVAVPTTKSRRISPKIYSNCEYHYDKMKYQTAITNGERRKCSTVPLQCVVPSCGQTIWKYNAYPHLLAAHGVTGKPPAMPIGNLVSLSICKKEELAAGVAPSVTREYQDWYNILSSVDLTGALGVVRGVTRNLCMSKNITPTAHKAFITSGLR